MLAAEAAVWEELSNYVAAAGRLRSTGVLCLPAAVIALQPGVAPKAYHPLRRAWRLSFALATVLDLEAGHPPPHRADDGGQDVGEEGGAAVELTRQSLLKYESTAARLEAILKALEDRRKMMTAALVLRNARSTKGP